MNTELEKIAIMYGDVWVSKMKQRRKRQKVLVLELLYEYAKNSTLHGLRYIVEKGITVIERLFWFLTVIISVVLCSFYVYNVVHKWKTNPIIVVLDDSLSSVASVPFPSVTICPEMKVNPIRYDYTEQVIMMDRNKSYLNEAQMSKLRHIHHTLCDNYLNVTFDEKKKITNSSLVDDITEAASTANDIIPWIWFKSNGPELIAEPIKVITEDGVCYTINSLDGNDIFADTIQSEYQYMANLEQPQGMSIEGDPTEQGQVFTPSPDSLHIEMNNPIEIIKDPDNTCNKEFMGFKIYLHQPSDYPQSSKFFHTVFPNQTTSLTIRVNEFNSDDNLRSYDPRIRQCYFPSERKLRYFKLYTLTNCQAECVSIHTYRMCKCVGFYMPHDNSSEICNPNIENNACMAKARVAATFNLGRRDNKDGREEECYCLPPCNSIEYDAEVNNNMNRGLLDGLATVDLFYKKPYYVKMVRREVFGMTDLLANIGGLLGVFLGFSFLSLIEIFYFLGVRIGFVLKKDLDEEKTNKQSKMDDIISISDTTKKNLF